MTISGESVDFSENGRMMEDLSDPEAFFTFDDIVIDAEDFTVTKSGDPATLTPRSFDVLVYIVRNRGRVVEKQEIFDAIWKDTFVTDNALTRVMKEIRGVLGDKANEPRYLETVHKRGYRFIAEVSVERRDARARVSNAGVIDPIERAGDLEAGKPTLSRYLTVAAGLLAAIAAFAGIYALQNRTTIRSIAVLPFVNESGDTNVEYLADGMTETLIGSLSKVSNLNVKSRSSVFRYKSSDVPLKTIGQELGVEAVIAGRVVQRGDELTLYLSLIDTGSENNIWSKQYSRRMDDLLVLQSEIANDVAVSLGATLTDSNEQQPYYTADPEAYRLYLQGRFHVLSTRSQGAETGISYFRQAIARDPRYALAYAGLAEAAMGLAFRSELPANDIFPQAKNDAMKAVEIDPQLANGFIALATVNIWYERDWKSANANIERALALAPNSADARLQKGIVLFSTARTVEGLDEMRLASELEPLNLRNLVVHAQFLNFAGRSGEALQLANKTLELNPNFYLGHLMVATAELQLGDTRGAIESAETSRSLNPVDSLPLALKAFALFRSGDNVRGKAALDELLAAAEVRYATPYNIALAHFAAGSSEAAITWLERAVEQRDIRTVFLNDPKWDGLRKDPRFQELVTRAGLTGKK